MLITAAEIARTNGLDPKRYRQALRDARLSWYVWGASWTVEVDSARNADLLRVLDDLLCSGTGPANATSRSNVTKATSFRSSSDEAYIVGLCDSVLRQTAQRQHPFDFLRGDPAVSGQVGRSLPVDAWYPELVLVIEYRERQHTESVKFFDRKPTISGIGRGEQRKLYDQRRRDVLPSYGIALVEFDYFDFQHTPNRRLIRCEGDRKVVETKLERFVD